MFRTRQLIAPALAALLAHFAAACSEDPNKQVVDYRVISKPGAINAAAEEQSNDGKGLVEQTFQAAQKESSEEKFNFENGVLNQELTLVKNYTDKSFALTQVDRPKVADSFTQAAVPTAQTDTFNISGSYSNPYALSRQPIGGTAGLTVKFDGVTQASGFSVINQSFYFDPLIPGNGTKIDISYNWAQNSVVAYTLSKVPADGTLTVKVDGIAQAANTYSINASTKTLTFNNPVAVGAKIDVDYRENVALTQEFVVGDKLKAGSIKVKVNNVETTSFSYDVSKGTIAITPMPGDAAKVDITALLDEGPKLVYELTQVGTDPRAFTAKDKNTGDAVAIQYEGGKATFQSADFQEGRVVSLVFKDITTITKELTLAHLPIADSVRVATGADTCIDGAGLSVFQEKIYIECEMAAASDFVVSYDYMGEPQKSYTLDMTMDPDTGAWEVYVNDELTGAFSRQGSTITLNAAPPVDATVKVRFTPSASMRSR